jgi:hypothetical protein
MGQLLETKNIQTAIAAFGARMQRPKPRGTFNATIWPALTCSGACAPFKIETDAMLVGSIVYLVIFALMQSRARNTRLH